MVRPLAVVLSVAVATIMITTTASAWVYPEHRDIAVAAVLKLDSARRVQLDSIWSWARLGHENRLPSSIVIPELPERPNYIDWGAWPAIGGDHSCSPSQMMDNVLNSDWILDVARITEQFKRKLISAKDHAQRLNALRDQDLQLQRADPDYATRAGSNNVHFLLARNSVKTTPFEYLEGSLSQGGEINALAVYIWYHYRAMAKIKRLREPGLSATQRSQLALAALADEAFGIHFLEDAFASGHVAGTWGNASLRKGTHDYYNEHGYETNTWDGKQVILMGDAYMRAEDIEAPARAVTTSLEQLVDAYLGIEPYASHSFDDREIDGLAMMEADTLNVCHNNDIPGKIANKALGDQYLEVIHQTPVPALKAGYGELPRFRTELGGFIGLAPYLRAAGWDGGFDPSQTSALGVGTLGLNLRLGLGLDGVTSDAGDGLVFIEVGIAHDNASTANFSDDSMLVDYGDLLAAIPSRASISTRIRMPFYLLPGDLILGAIFVAPFSMQTFTQMAVVAGNGGLVPWQAGIATTVGRFQFILGREVGVQFYGFGSGSQKILVPYESTNQQAAELLDLRSILVEAPIVEWRPFRTFSVDQSSSMVVQFYGAADIPVYWKSHLTPPTTHDLRTRWGLGLRVAFDWRYYY
jgi:hypothetical protein